MRERPRTAYREGWGESLAATPKGVVGITDRQVKVLTHLKFPLPTNHLGPFGAGFSYNGIRESDLSSKA